MLNKKMKITQLLKIIFAINKTEEEEAFIERLISINFPLKVINYVIGNNNSCDQKTTKNEKFRETSKKDE